MLKTENPFNVEFCETLEYRLCQTFGGSNQNELRRLWCDGVSSEPFYDNQLNKSHVNKTRRIVTKAWIGISGQDEYEMTIYFGKCALSRFTQGTEMMDCIPESDSMDWINIDTENRKIEIKLK